MDRWKCVCAYDGTDFTGWQAQPTRDSVQDTIEQALSHVFKRPVRIQGSGRTDAGVHALAQVFHFDGNWAHGGPALVAAVRAHTPASIQVVSAEPVDTDFHARFSARGKRYHYRLFLGSADPFEARYCLSVPYSLDLDLIQEAGRSLIGELDFKAFAASTGYEEDMEKSVKDFRLFEVTREGSRIRLTFEASGFMYKMVRSLTGALLRVGSGKLNPDRFGAILRSGDRTQDVVTAPPQGLFLEKVYY